MRTSKKNNGKAMILFYALVITIGGLSFSNKMVSANNCADKTFTFNYSGDGSDYTSRARTKMDQSHTYVKNNTSSKATLSVAAEAKEGVKNGEYGSPFNYTYSTAWHNIKVGKCLYFKNKLPKRYKTTYLAMSSVNHGAYHYSVTWSPDNKLGFK